MSRFDTNRNHIRACMAALSDEHVQMLQDIINQIDDQLVLPSFLPICARI